MHDRIPASSLDVREHPRAWETSQVAITPRKSDPISGCAGTAVQPDLYESWNGTPPRSRRYRLADRWPARADRSRRTSAAPVAGLA
jgi:hypothetical protein